MSLKEKGGEIMIKCKICGGEFVVLKKHLKIKHDMTTSQYKKLFPDAEIYSNSYLKRKRAIAKRQKENGNLKNFKKGFSGVNE